MNLSTEQKQSHGHREEICGCQGKGGESGMLDHMVFLYLVFRGTSILFS